MMVHATVIAATIDPTFPLWVQGVVIMVVLMMVLLRRERN